ncbi:hypothetical protein RND81_04G090100 [Saponaria officinalis]|uniref:Uncharacterized protein n=1 Tax=Saponaria officinalis TaxID=3572 RepID=A0AAW1LHQ0_SAPOF
MEKLSINLWKGLKKYCNKNGYVRLNINEKPTQTRTRARDLRSQERRGSTALQGRQRRRFWRVKLNPRTRVLSRVGSPKRWITRVRDAYVNMMINISKTGLVTGGCGQLGTTVEYGDVFGEGRIREYDEKMIQQVYKNVVVAQSQWVRV